MQVKTLLDGSTICNEFYVSVTKIYQEINQTISSPPLQLNYTNSIVARADGKYGTTYAQVITKVEK